MPALPEGDPGPADGSLPGGLDWTRPLRAYVHVPFCTVRCGYCDFNTYTAAELGGGSQDGWLAALRLELRQAAAACGPVPVDTVFVGGGTPSLLGARGLAAVLEAVRDAFDDLRRRREVKRLAEAKPATPVPEGEPIEAASTQR